MLELKISIRKDKKKFKDDKSTSALHSPTTKPTLSSHKKKQKDDGFIKKGSSKKKTLDSSANNSVTKMKSMAKLNSKMTSSTNLSNSKNGYSQFKGKRIIHSESKRDSGVQNENQFNDISEIQEFNITDEESMMNASILKNIEDHDSINHRDAL